MSIFQKFFGPTTRYDENDCRAESVKPPRSDEEIIATAKFKIGDRVASLRGERWVVGYHTIKSIKYGAHYTNPYLGKDIIYITDRLEKGISNYWFDAVLAENLTEEQKQHIASWEVLKAEFQVFELWNGQFQIHFRSNFNRQKNWRPLKNYIQVESHNYFESRDSKYEPLLFQRKDQAIQLVNVLKRLTKWEELEYFSPDNLLAASVYGTLVYETSSES